MQDSWVLWALAALSMAGAALNADRRREGFLLWFVANAGWIWAAASAGVWSMAALYAYFLATTVVGWRRWSGLEEALR